MNRRRTCPKCGCHRSSYVHRRLCELRAAELQRADLVSRGVVVPSVELPAFQETTAAVMTWTQLVAERADQDCVDVRPLAVVSDVVANRERPAR